MLQLLKKWMTKIFSDAHGAIVGLLIVMAIGYLVTLTRTQWFSLFELLKTPLPLWSLILLVLCSVALTYSITSRIQNNPSEPPIPYKIKYYNVGDYRWKVGVYRDDYFEMADMPLCIIHDLTFICYQQIYSCPENINGKCSPVFYGPRYNSIKEDAKSHIDKMVRDEFIPLSKKIASRFK